MRKAPADRKGQLNCPVCGVKVVSLVSEANFEAILRQVRVSLLCIYCVIHDDGFGRDNACTYMFVCFIYRFSLCAWCIIHDDCFCVLLLFLHFFLVSFCLCVLCVCVYVCMCMACL